jgi:hypothetical protein
MTIGEAAVKVLFRRSLGAALVVAAVLPLAALAVPEPVYVLGSGESGGSLTLAGSSVKAGATAPSTFKCNKKNVVIPKAIPIKNGGSFSYTGKMKGQSGTVVFKGTLKAGDKMSGSTKVTKGSCKSTKKWTGKLAA